MEIYTKTGDKGKTALIGGRVDKDDIRVEAYGSVDELNGFVGKIITELDSNLFSDMINDLERIQHELFDCGGDLASVSKRRPIKLGQESIDYLEKRIDELTNQAPEIKRFILPGGTGASATVHIARTITRRAERQVVTLTKQEVLESEIPLKYLNRLSDYFFALARVINAKMGMNDIEYARSARVFRTNKNKNK